MPAPARAASPPPLGAAAAALAAAVGGDEPLDTGDVVIREGPDDATYIYVDLTDADPSISLTAGDALRLTGLGTAAPTLARAGGGPPLVGEWRETVGSLVFAAEAADGEPGGYIGHGERVLYFGGGGGGAASGRGSRSRSRSAAPDPPQAGH